MSKKTAQDFDPEFMKLFDSYVHGISSRRDFLLGATKYAAAAGVTSAGLLTALSPNFAEAQQVKPSDKRIKATYVEFPSPKGYGTVRGYLVEPAKIKGKLPVILVVHENRGLNPHIEDIARRLALEGFIALAPDALFPFGGYPGNEDDARNLFQKLDQIKTQQDFIASAKFLESYSKGNGKLGVVGFCYGGGMANYLAANLPELKAAVPFYGRGADLETVPQIQAPLLIHFAGLDERVNAGWPGYEKALKEAGKAYDAYVYEGVQHGFNNNTTPRYDEKAAALAWNRTIEFFIKHLK